jgi:cytochrome c553
MTKIPSPATLVAALCLAAASAHAADVAHGKQLQTGNCMSCHDDSVYTRADHKITTLDGLQKQVRRCELTLELQWFDDDIDDVAAYLNQTYYKFR